MKFFCIADEDTVRGFRLAGVPGRAVATAAAAANVLATAAAEADCSVIILTDEFAAALRPQLEQIRFGRERPLIVEISGPAGLTSGHINLGRLVQEAIGIRLPDGKGD